MGNNLYQQIVRTGNQRKLHLAGIQRAGKSTGFAVDLSYLFAIQPYLADKVLARIASSASEENAICPATERPLNNTIDKYRNIMTDSRPHLILKAAFLTPVHKSLSGSVMVLIFGCWGPSFTRCMNR